MLALVVVTAAVVLTTAGSARAQPDPAQWGLTSFCTPAQDFPATRRFRVRNNSGVAQAASLRNQTNGQTSSFVAPTGDSFQLVPANANPSSANTTQLVVGGVVVNTKAANNRACSTLVGNAVCDTSTGLFTITWTMRNNGTGPSTITASSVAELNFAPNPVPANATATATEQVAGVAEGSVLRTLTLTVDLGSSVIGNPTAAVTLGQCERPIPPRIGFTFTKSPSVTVADVGDVITYTYAGTNTGEVPLEVTQLVDDRLGIVISDPDVETVVPPGGSITRSVPYTVVANDGAIGRIDNNAVVTVVPRAGPDQSPRTGTANAAVVVRPPPSPSLAGNVVCDPDTPGEVALTWTLTNGGPGDAVILASSRPGVLDGGTVAPDASLTATEVVASPDSGTTDVTLSVTTRGAPPVSSTVTIAPCLAPVTDFTFTKAPSAAIAAPGDVITYTYAGTNTGTGPLEVLQLVDDRLGVVIEDPDVATIVAPGDSITRQVTYTVTPADQTIGTIDNTAIVTVRPTTGPDQSPRTGAASASVTVPPPPPRPIPALEGNAVCEPTTRSFDITWTLRNTGEAAAIVESASRTGTFTAGTSIAPAGSATASETVPAPADTAAVDLTVTIAGAGPVSATITLGRCEPPPEPSVGFTFVKTADRALTNAGETVTYTYRGTNTGDIALEVTQLVDDRLGVLLEDPDVDTVVAPGGSIERRITYVVTLDDAAIGDILNIATATIVPAGSDEPLTAVADAGVEVVAPLEPPIDPDPDPTTTTSTAPTTTTPSTTTSTDAATTTTVRRGALPATGRSTSTATWAALVAATGGLLLLALARRPRSHRR